MSLDYKYVPNKTQKGVWMNELFTVLERFAPEAIEMMQERFQILRQVLYNQPIGRRQLGKNIGLSERTVRSEIEVLKARGAIETSAAGICLTVYGEELLRSMENYAPWFASIHNLAEIIKSRFSLRDVVVVPGDCCYDSMVRKDMGRAAAEYLRKILFPGCILAVTGGTSMAEVAAAMREGINIPRVCVVPARGGLGENVEQQAGTIAALIAKTIGAQYRLLHIPDNIEESTAQALKRDSHISGVVKIIKSSNILMHGIGPAMEMAERRRLSPEEKKYLQENQAEAEALRYYFNSLGKIIFEIPGIGIEKDDLKNIQTIIAVAGGSDKAEAVKAVLSSGQESVLITDEGAAQKIVKG